MVRALAFIRREQEPGGSWFGRWGVNHIYGTAAVLVAMRAVGEDMSATWLRRAADWLATRQGESGGWGESCASYADPAWVGRGPSTASQTAWALLGLLAADPTGCHGTIGRGIGFLSRTQRDGSWDEPYYTGCGFPGYGIGGPGGVAEPVPQVRWRQGVELQRGFMINYNLYRHYFPLAALGRAVRAGF
jgi:squalene-hopene/tetraprenyl-beta-curcumene cyclase